MQWLKSIACATALAVTAATTVMARETRILYAEGFSPTVVSTSGARKTGQSQRWRVRTFGQELPLLLEKNARLEAYIPAAARSRVGDFSLLRGSVEGRENSWIRLMLRNGRYEGAIWDGSELYVVEPRDALPADQYVQAGAAAASVIYRASDIADDGKPMICGNGAQPIAKNVLQRYKSVVSELQAIDASAASRDIEVAVVGDYEYFAHYGSAALQTMISRMNMVDGIYSSQLNVNIIPTDFTVFTTSAEPFSGTDPGTLLEQFGNYRNETPVIRSRGLAHLFTGRDLDGSVVGVGYRGTLCEPQTGVSLSESDSPAPAMLIIAHELGHNFGASHDGEPGSVCSSTPQTFLMSPIINGSTTFSNCSIQSMQSNVAAAACVVSSQGRDVAVTVPVSPVAAVISRAFDYVADVASTGQGTAYNTVATASFDGNLQIQTAAMPDAACTVSGNTVNCQIGTLEAGQTRRLTVSVLPTSLGTLSTQVSVLSSSDRNPANDTLTVPVEVSAQQAASIAFSPATQSVGVRTPFQTVATITATGADPLVDAVARVRFGPGTISAISVDAGNCAQNAGEWVCQLQTLSPQQTRRLTIDTTATNINGVFLSVEVSAGTSPQRVVGSGGSAITVAPQYDIAIVAPVRDRIIAVGDTAEYPITIESRGLQAVPAAHMTITSAVGVTLEFSAPGVTCVNAVNSLDCNLGTMAPGATVTGQLRAHADTILRSYLGFDIPQAIPDDNRINNHFLLNLDVRAGSDVAVANNGGGLTLRDGLPVNTNFTFFSQGVTAPTDVRATLTLPQSFIVQSAKMEGGTCTVTGSTISCQLASMTTSYKGIEVSMTAPEPGNYTGQFQVTAANDAAPTNDSAQLQFTVVPNVDARLVSPTGLRTYINEAVDVRLEIVANRYTLTNARLDIDLNTNMTVESIQAGSGSCALNNFSIACQLGTLSPSSTTTVTLRVRPTSGTQASLYPRFSSPDDIDIQNNQAQVVIGVDALPDAVLTAPSIGSSGIVNTQFLVGDIRVRAAGAVKNAFIEFTFDATRLTQPGASSQSPFSCTWTAGSGRCSMGDLPEGITRLVTFSFTPTVAGSLPIRIRVDAAADTNPADNEQNITITVQAATTPTPPVTPDHPAPPAGSNGGGGGGGGSMSLPALLPLLGLWLLAVGRRRAGRAFSSSSPQ